MIFKELHTERLLLRKVEETDNEFVLSAYSNNELTKFMLHRYYNLEEIKIQMQHYKDMYQQNTGCAWILENSINKHPMGIVSVFNYSSVHKKTEIGFWILPSFQKQGYITEAAKAVINYCFNHININRIEATVETENIASITVIKKLKLQHEGTFREYEINNGKFIDLMMFAILRKDWQC